MNPLETRLRPALPEDATTLSALAVQVFFDTYATEGVRPDLAREAFATCSAESFAARACLAHLGTRRWHESGIEVVPLEELLREIDDWL